MPALTTGNRIGDRYRVEVLVGSGGMGSVYKAVDLMSGECVAIKVLHDHLMDNPRVFHAFRNEAHVQTQLAHPNIVSVLAFIETPYPCIVMPFIDGPSLESVLEQERNGSPLSVEEVFSIIGPVLRALAYSHARQVVHRDIKPGNIMLNRAGFPGMGRPMITDFGLVRIMDEGSSTRRVRMGTPPYMAPEQYRYVQDVGPQADVYAVGMLMWHLFTGTLPVNHRDEVALEAFYDGQFRPQDLVKMDCPVSVELSDIVKASLRADLHRRPRDAGAFLEALGIYRSNSSVSYGADSLDEPATDEVTLPVGADELYAKKPLQSPLKQPWFWVLGALLAWALSR